MRAWVTYEGRFRGVNKYKIRLDTEAANVLRRTRRDLLNQCGIKLTLGEVDKVKPQIANALGIEVESGQA